MSRERLAELVRLRIFGKSPVNAYLRLNELLWKALPSSLTALRPLRSYGHFLNELVRLSAKRRQFFGTFFLRNRPELELIRRLSIQKDKGSTLRIAVLGCSNGAEVYSILWTLRHGCPHVIPLITAVDISTAALQLAQKGSYNLDAPELVQERIFDRLTTQELRDMFDREEDQVRIKPWIKEGIVWHLADAADPELVRLLGPQDMVVASNFLCHMHPRDAERCLRNISGLVRSGGYLFVSGVDLDVRTRVAKDLSWKPIRELLEEIHNGDPVLRRDWPFAWWGLEPINRRRQDWQLRYAAAFQLGSGAALAYVDAIASAPLEAPGCSCLQ